MRIMHKLLMICLLIGATAVNANVPTGQFSGRATVLKATVLGITTTVSDTGPLPSSGGAIDASLLTVNAPLGPIGFSGSVSADVAHATAIGQGDESSAEASVADVRLVVGTNTISAGFLM